MFDDIVLQEHSIMTSSPTPIYYSRTLGDVNMPINNWTINLVLGIVLTIIAGGGFWIFKRSIEDAALAEAKVVELQKELQQQEEYINDLTEINKKGNELIADLKNKESTLNSRIADLEVYLNNHKDTTQSSEVLKRTFKELSQ